jgi:hypothetical protein
MKKEIQEFLDTIEPIDTTPSLERMEAIRNEAREEVKRENEKLIGETK